MKPGKNGTVIAVDEKDNAVVIIGKYGRGRYVACGIGLGIMRGDKDSDMTNDDKELLYRLVNWSANVKQ
jgi:hypothetical protein